MQVNSGDRTEHVVVGVGKPTETFLVSQRVIQQAHKIGMTEQEAVLRSFRATTAVFQALEEFSEAEKLSALMNVSAIVSQKSIGWNVFADEARRTCEFYQHMKETHARIDEELARRRSGQEGSQGGSMDEDGA